MLSLTLLLSVEPVGSEAAVLLSQGNMGETFLLLWTWERIAGAIS